MFYFYYDLHFSFQISKKSPVSNTERNLYFSTIIIFLFHLLCLSLTLMLINNIYCESLDYYIKCAKNMSLSIAQKIAHN